MKGEIFFVWFCFQTEPFKTPNTSILIQILRQQLFYHKRPFTESKSEISGGYRGDKHAECAPTYPNSK